MYVASELSDRLENSLHQETMSGFLDAILFGLRKVPGESHH